MSTSTLLVFALFFIGINCCYVNPFFGNYNCTAVNLVITYDFQYDTSYSLSSYTQGTNYFQISLVASGISDYMMCETVCGGTSSEFVCGGNCEQLVSSTNVANLWFTSDITAFKVSSSPKGSCQTINNNSDNVLKISQLCYP